MKKLLITGTISLLMTLYASAQATPFFSEGQCTSTKESRQGAACYDGILFQFHNANDIIEIFDLNKGLKTGEIAQSPSPKQHCNTVAFGKKKWVKTDRFPLIYISTERDERILVCRIKETNGGFSIETVQNIFLPTSEDMGLYFPNSIIDGRHNYLYLSGYTQNSWQQPIDGNQLRYIQLPLPDPHAGDITLDLSKPQHEFTLPFTYATQGVVVHKGRICQAYGTSKRNIIFRKINPRNGRVTLQRNAEELGFEIEPEGTFIYKGRLAVVTIFGDCYFIE